MYLKFSGTVSWKDHSFTFISRSEMLYLSRNAYNFIC